MPPVDRDNPVRGKASASQYSVMEFMREFPGDRACLEWLWRERYAPDGHHTHCPNCDRVRKFHKVNGRPTWDCDHCGHHINPLAGTIFHKSSTSLHLWFYAIHLMTSTRCGIAAKQLERELGVTYKTAWRMFNLIRNRLRADDDGTPLFGAVEVDEPSVEGKPRRHMRRSDAARLRERSRATVVAAVERGGHSKLASSNPGAVQPSPQPSSSGCGPSPSSTPTSGPRTTRRSCTSTTVEFATRPANTSSAMPTRTPSRGSSGASRRGFAATTRRPRAAGFRAT
jgi:transposase-like protein